MGAANKNFTQHLTFVAPRKVGQKKTVCLVLHKEVECVTSRVGFGMSLSSTGLRDLKFPCLAKLLSGQLPNFGQYLDNPAWRGNISPTWEQNRIPMNMKSWEGVSSDFS
jgi:hypothetical protein